MTAEVLSSVQAGRLHLATAVSAGPWLFVTGIRAAGPDGALADEAKRGEAPHRTSGKQYREAEVVLRNLRENLVRGGCAPGDIVRLDQYYSDWRAVPHYQLARRRAFSGAIPASTSILESALLLPGTEIEVQALARRRSDAGSCQFITPSGLEVSPHMGFSPIVKTPELIFFAGQMAEHGNAGIAEEAKVPKTHLWKGLPIRLETEYLIRHKLEPALEVAEVPRENIVKAQVYLRDIEDAPAFNDVWRDWHGGKPPPVTIVPTSDPGFNCPDASVEVNLLAAPGGATGQTPKRIEPDRFAGLYEDYPAATAAGGLLFVSGLTASDEHGLVPVARRGRSVPFFTSAIRDQMEEIIAQADAICADAGARLEDVVRILLFHTDLNEFYGACESWQERLGGAPLPVTGIEVPGPLSVPGASVLADLWVAT